MQSIHSGGGSVSVLVDSITTSRIVGLGDDNGGVGYQDIIFGAYLARNNLMVFESGNYKGNFGTIAVGDRIRVAVEDDVVNYYRNGVLFYTSNVQPAYPLVVKAAIADMGGTVLNATFCNPGGGSSTPTPIPTSMPTQTLTPTSTDTFTPTPTSTSTSTSTSTLTDTFTPTSTSTSTQTPTPTATFTSTSTLSATPTPTPTSGAGSGCQAVSWTVLQNVSVQGNSIYKVSGNQATWDAGASSIQTIDSGIGYVQATVDDTSSYKLFGLSWGNHDPLPSDTDYAFYMAAGALRVYQNGVLSANVGAYAMGDVLKIAIEVDGLVHFYRNGIPLYVSIILPTYPVDFDSAINTMGAGITNAFICGQNLSASTPTATFTPTPTYTATQVVTGTPGSGGGPTLDGCPMFPANNIWNRNIASLPVHPQSDEFVSSLGASNTLHPGFGSGTWNGYPIGIPYITVSASQPLVPIYIYQYPNESDPGPARVPTNAPIEAPTDAHTSILENGTCTLYEMFHATPVPDGSWNAGSAARFDMNSNNLRPNGWTSTDAAGFALLPGLVRYDEAMAGPISHAVRFTGDLNGIRNTYVWPARHTDGRSTSSSAPPMGTRFRLKSWVDISGYPQPLRNILQGLKDYGMFLADSTSPGESWNVTGVPDSRWNNNMLHTMNDIPGSYFEAVDESGLIIDPNSGQSR
jgi:hypothetical protein